jgi:hypothetical protein
VVPVYGADLVMSQAASPVPLLVTLDKTLSGTACTGPAVTLNGQPQKACGNLSQVTVVNARGSEAGWTLSGQLTGDFLDPVAPVGSSCDASANYNLHCIPGDNLDWTPAAAVAHTVVAGDVAHVTAGGVTTTGLHDSAQTLCGAATTTSGGTFHCDAALAVTVPASAFAPGADGFRATLTLTLV